MLIFFFDLAFSALIINIDHRHQLDIVATRPTDKKDTQFSNTYDSPDRQAVRKFPTNVQDRTSIMYSASL